MYRPQTNATTMNRLLQVAGGIVVVAAWVAVASVVVEPPERAVVVQDGAVDPDAWKRALQKRIHDTTVAVVGDSDPGPSARERESSTPSATRSRPSHPTGGSKSAPSQW